MQRDIERAMWTCAATMPASGADVIKVGPIPRQLCAPATQLIRPRLRDAVRLVDRVQRRRLAA
jgi:hypothetical protein